MKNFTLLAAAWLLCFLRPCFSQCNFINDLSVIDASGQELGADAECTDADGWTHYFNSSSGKLLLSVKKNGQNIGAISAGLTVHAGILSGYGSGGFNLSTADYIDNDIWTVAHRYWQIMGASSISAPIKIRFYFSHQDVADIAASVDDFGFYVDEPEDLYMFTLGKGSGLYPLSTSTQWVNAQFTLYDMVPGASPDWSVGTFNGFPYSEFEVPTVDVGGGLGFLIFLPEAPVAVTGNVSKESGAPVPGVSVQAAAASVGQTNFAGNFLCPNLPVGNSYEIVPKKLTNPAEGITTVDLIAINRHLLGIEPLESPYRLIAADADKDGIITLADQTLIRKVLLGVLPVFPNNDSWRFVPEAYVFPDPEHPFSSPFPETIPLNNLSDSINNQDFVAIKTGDVADETTGNPPPTLSTVFALPSQFSTCNTGDTVSLPLTVQDFQGVSGFQFTIEWDPAVLQFLSTGNYNLTTFSQQNIGTLYDEEGKLTFAWFNPNNGGASLPDGTVICELRFIAAGDFSQSTALQFTGSVTPALVVHQNLVENVPAFQAGYFHLENNSTLAATATLQPAGCEGIANGSIDLNLSGETQPVSYLWSNGATTQDLTDLPGGTFWVTIADASGACPKIFKFTLPPNEPILLQGTVGNMSCPSQVDGSISLAVSGGASPLIFAWSNGKTSQNLSGLFQGIYSVTVTDAVGCTSTASFTVNNPNQIFPNVSIVNASSPTASNGAVMVNSISGSQAPFSFAWNTGANTQSLYDLPAGDYIVTITDGMSCQHVFGYLVNVLNSTASEEETSEVKIQLFPNPAIAGQQVNLLLANDMKGKWAAAIFSPDGRKWREAEMENGIFAAPEVAGMYLLRLQNGEKRIWLRLVVK